MIEVPPKITNSTSPKNNFLQDGIVKESINRLQDSYAYWSEVKYKKIEGIPDAHNLWSILKNERASKSVDVYPKYNLHFALTNQMMRLCHLFDMNFGGKWGSESIIPKESSRRYLLGSIIEEAISSSQMEGASTTRKIAKEMLRKNITPKDKSQRMIYNNFQTIQYLAAHTAEPLSLELILQIYGLITKDTLENPEYSGKFRQNNDVVVENAITHEVVHIPPSFTEIASSIEWLVNFVNNDDTSVFIHPIIKATIIHFFISYLHPFVDGNGRTARALFHWYMLKEGYWLTEYLSISRVIYKSKASYEKSFLYAEADHNDMGYFITYHLNALQKAFEELKKYISRKTAQQNDQNRLIKLGNVTQRQAEILYMFLKNEDKILTVRDITSKLLISPTTAKHDIVGLVDQSLLSEISLNRQKKGYIRGEKYNVVIDTLYT
ncbi:MAG: Fic family protein [Muribaculaceae bacterium]|nr:Fic family protein [Muribaculaceae bacterium]